MGGDKGGTPALERVLPEVEEDEELWLVAHEDLRRSPRIRAVFDTIADACERDRDFFEGRGPSRFQGPRLEPRLGQGVRGEAKGQAKGAA